MIWYWKLLLIESGETIYSDSVQHEMNAEYVSATTQEEPDDVKYFIQERSSKVTKCTMSQWHVHFISYLCMHAVKTEDITATIETSQSFTANMKLSDRMCHVLSAPWATIITAYELISRLSS